MKGKIRRYLRRNMIVKASLVVSLITLASKGLGYGEKILVAHRWGTGYQADVYNAVFVTLIGIAVFFREIFEPGMLNKSIHFKQQDGPGAYRRVFVSMFYFMAIPAIIISGAMFAWPDLAGSFFLPGFEGDRARLASSFFRNGSIGLFFLIVINVSNTWLLANKSFITIAVSEFLFKAMILWAAIALFRPAGIHALIYGLVGGALLKAGVQLAAIRKKSGPLNLRPQPEYVRTILWVSMPLLLGNMFSLVGNIADNFFASFLREGAISGIHYAKKVIDLPVILFPYTLSMIVFPYFTELSAERDEVRLYRLLDNSVKYILLFFVPLMLLIGTFSREIIRVIYQHGLFDHHSTSATSRALSAYNFGLVGFALETILVIFLFARGQIRYAVGLGIVTVLLNIMVTAVLLGTMGPLAIVFGLVFSKWVKVFLLLRKIKIQWKKFIRFTGGWRIVTAFALFSVLPLTVKISGCTDGSRLSVLLILGGTAFLSFSLYGWWLYRTRIIRFNDAREY